MTKNASTQAARDRRHAARAEERDAIEQLAHGESELREVEMEMDRVRAELEFEQGRWRSSVAVERVGMW